MMIIKVLRKVTMYERQWLERARYQIHMSRLLEQVIFKLKENRKVGKVQRLINNRLTFDVLKRLKSLSDASYEKINGLKLKQNRRKLRKVLVELRQQVKI